ncbi:MAG: D-2-hydroxyacid dehydrogenase [Pseudomonadota bacterium]
MHGVFLDLATYKPDERHPALLELTLKSWDFHDSTPADQVVDRLKSADIAVLNKVQMTRDVLSQLPDLKLVVAGATGVDNIDAGAAKELGISVCNVRGYSTEAVAQLTFSMLLALATNLIPYHNLVQSGAWQRTPGFNLLEYPLIELHGKTLGVIGYGDIGQAVERIALAFGMKVLVAERRGADTLRDGRSAFEEVIEQSDTVTIHCPMTEETRGLIGAQELEAMKDSAFILNVSRGGIIDEQALAKALVNHKIAGAALDVLSKEPPRDGNPLLGDGIPNLILTPHCAWASVEARLRMFEQIADVITAFKDGKPINLVT